ncbi:hypothetical protein [Pseudonocardia xishanensis]|uniref:Uncharacterized protein n=1 Tax=Pseudonocardia xishanensis TaxID=630995 RepID=A0ABP8S1Y1_9PSEU
MTSTLRSHGPLPEPRPVPHQDARASGLRAAPAPRSPDDWVTGRWRRPAGTPAPWTRGAAPVEPTPAVPPVSRASWPAFLGELGALVGTALVAWAAVRGLDGVLPAPRPAAVLALAGGTVAATATAVAGRASGSRRAVRIAAAIAGYTLVGPLGTALDLHEGGLWPGVEVVGLLGVVALLVVAVRRRSAARRPVVVAAGAALACAATLAGTVGELAPAFALPPGAAPAALLAAWAGTGAAGLLALVAGLRRDRPLLRRVGLAFAALAAAHAVAVSGVAATVPVALTLAATAALLAAAVPFLFSAVRGLWEQREAYRVEAELLRAALEHDRRF